MITARPYLVGAALVPVWLITTAGVAAAADDQVVVDSSLHQVQVFSVILGVFLPLLVGLVTKVTTSASTKAVLLAALAAISGFLTEAVNAGGLGDEFDWWGAILTAITTFVVAVGLHFGLWKPTGASVKAQQMAVK